MRKLNDEQRKLVEDNYSLIFYVMGKYNFTKQIEYEDCYGALAEGLCSAAASFDSSKGVSFASYAFKCMVNAVLMFKRKNDRPKEFSIISIDSPINDDGTILVVDTIPNGVNHAEDVENSEVIRMVLSDTKEKWDGIAQRWKGTNAYGILMLSAEGMKQVDIASKVGVTRSAVSHSLKSIKKDLSNRLAREGYGHLM